MVHLVFFIEKALEFSFLEEQELLELRAVGSKVIRSGGNVCVKTRGQTMLICFLLVRGIICYEFVPLNHYTIKLCGFKFWTIS